jgi:CheY-like chemotaxis protein
VHILVATDADFVLDEVTAALSGPDTSFTVCRNGRDVSKVIATRTPDLAILDLQIGSMGGMAVTMALRLDESAGLLPHVPVLMLLDRTCRSAPGPPQRGRRLDREAARRAHVAAEPSTASSTRRSPTNERTPRSRRRRRMSAADSAEEEPVTAG